ncbi:hypothetical protein SSSM5_152 [Synechococcus phage S-SSM5]|uniref:Uncharacterized protein n=1 Tax=Synechococcus phage S-SSM5 TaxID=445685 RepID=E3SKJ2_9CAUD|nr:hypothetical protein SSSM5_152 [Synechococcus phage S-SSM5]ADO97918.1 hypothetical protein SSSM5_152 [Synechococcus phage S-SSM5]
MMEVKLIRMVTGEELVAEVLDWRDGFVTIKNALVVIPQQNQVGFAQWASVIDPENPEITLDMKHVIYCAECAPDVVKQYGKIFGSNLITTPEEKKLIL